MPVSCTYGTGKQARCCFRRKIAARSCRAISWSAFHFSFHPLVHVVAYACNPYKRTLFSSLFQFLFRIKLAFVRMRSAIRFMDVWGRPPPHSRTDDNVSYGSSSTGGKPRQYTHLFDHDFRFQMHSSQSTWNEHQLVIVPNSAEHSTEFSAITSVTKTTKPKRVTFVKGRYYYLMAICRHSHLGPIKIET